MNMKRTLMAAALATATSPAMACTDWRAVAAFDAIIAANAEKDIDEMNKEFEKVLNVGGKLSDGQVYTSISCTRKGTAMSWS